jgi:hypothetical protein
MKVFVCQNYKRTLAALRDNGSVAIIADSLEPQVAAYLQRHLPSLTESEHQHLRERFMIRLTASGMAR